MYSRLKIILGIAINIKLCDQILSKEFFKSPMEYSCNVCNLCKMFLYAITRIKCVNILQAHIKEYFLVIHANETIHKLLPPKDG
jgi:hypothetical protein